MNNRLTIQDLAGLLAEYTGKDKKNTERFLREFIQIVTEGVYADKLVKVKGLGTFKVILVEKRESIHVHTGERFVIPAHYKFSFLPDKELREQVNRPFSIFETTELEADVDFTDVPVTSENQPEMGDEQEEESVEEVLPEVSQPLPDKPESAEEKALPEETAEVKEKKKTGWIGGVVALLVAGVIVFVCYLIPSLSGERKNTEKRLSADTVRTEAHGGYRPNGGAGCCPFCGSNSCYRHCGYGTENGTGGRFLCRFCPKSNRSGSNPFREPSDIDCIEVLRP